MSFTRGNGVREVVEAVRGGADEGLVRASEVADCGKAWRARSKAGAAGLWAG